MLAEITADAVCARLVSERVQNNPEEYDGFHWDQYYAEYSKLISRFLPTGPKSFKYRQKPDGCAVQQHAIEQDYEIS